MRKFIILSLLGLTIGSDVFACADLSYGRHNNYLFSVFRREMMNEDLFSERTNAFWKEYTGGAVETYQWHSEDIFDMARSKGDKEMVAYLTQLNAYLAICDQLRETWSYPTKEELQQRQQTLQSMITASRINAGGKLAPQWSLLQMRANMLLGNHQENISFWEQKGSKMGSSVYRDMMQNIYAGSLLRQGRRTEACEIYAQQEDMVSIKWAMRKFRNLAGIKTIFAEDPNSQTINFLVQDFVNNMQETLDNGEDSEWYKEIDSRLITVQEANEFITFAQQVVDKKQSKTPALWLAAIGELQWLMGKDTQAVSTLEKAVKAKGTPRMLDNARAILMVASVRPSALDKKYTQWLIKEIDWLNQKIKEEAQQNIQDGYQYFAYHYNHYYDVLDRLVYSELVPKYKTAGNKNCAYGLVAMMDNTDRIFGIEAEIGDWNPNYRTEFFYFIDEEADAAGLASFLEWTTSSTNDALEVFAKRYSPSRDYLNDLIGTRYIAEGQFNNAIPYLQQVPLSFIKGQNISYYMTHRDFTVPRWLNKQADDEKGDVEGPNMGEPKSNAKIDFCNDIIQLEQQYHAANTQMRQKLAYELAKRYYQASYAGECWWLTGYGQSVYDTVRVGRADFVQRAIEYLQVSKNSNDFSLMQNSLYALAFIPTEPWAEIDWDWRTSQSTYKPIENARQYKALAELSAFERKNHGRVSNYVSHCDVLREFREATQ